MGMANVRMGKGITKMMHPDRVKKDTRTKKIE